MASSSTRMLCIKGSLEIAKERARGSLYTIMAVCMRANGPTTREMGGVTSDSSMATYIRANSSMGKLLGRGCSHGHMGKYTMANGTMVSKKDMEYGEVKRVTHLLDSGK